MSDPSSAGRRSVRAPLALAAALVLMTGCSALTGRPARAWVEDHAIIAHVKTRLAAMRASTLTRINVDTLEHTVYLSGIVDSEDTKRRAEELARSVDGVEQVVTNLQVRRARSLRAASPNAESASAAVGAASPATEQPFAVVARGFSHPLLSRFPGLARIDGDPLGHPNGPFVGYDRHGRLVATIYTISMRDLAERGLDDLETRGQRIDHVSLYPIAADPDVPDLQCHVLLWNISAAEAAKLR